MVQEADGSRRNLKLDRNSRQPHSLQHAGYAPSTPSEWFCRRFPMIAKQYGCPFLEELVTDSATDRQTTIPLNLNIEFFAATLSDCRLGHKTVYYQPESQFYFLDVKDQLFKPVEEAKLMTVVSMLLLRCAEELDAAVNRYNLFVTFREDETLKTIIKKARSIHSADSTFFSPTSPFKRVEGPECGERTARRFINSTVKPTPGQVLSVTECFDRFAGYCRENGVEAMNRQFFKQIVGEIIKEEFGVGLRSDLKNEQGRYCRGWKGLAVADFINHN